MTPFGVLCLRMKCYSDNLKFIDNTFYLYQDVYLQYWNKLHNKNLMSHFRKILISVWNLPELTFYVQYIHHVRNGLNLVFEIGPHIHTRIDIWLMRNNIYILSNTCTWIQNFTLVNKISDRYRAKKRQWIENRFKVQHQVTSIFMCK